MTKKLLLYCLFYFSVLFGYAQNSTLDSLGALLAKRTQLDTVTINLRNEIAYELRYTYPDSAFNMAKKTLQASKEINYIKGIVGSEYVVGIYAANKSDYTLAIQSYFNCLENLNKSPDERQKARVLNNIGIVYYFQRKYDKADEFLLKALEINEKIQNYSEVIRCYNNLGRIQFDQLQYEKALYYAQKALHTLNAHRIKGDLSVYYCNLAEYSMTLKRDSAEVYANTSLDKAITNKNVRVQVRAKIILAAIYLQQNNIKPITSLLNEAELALKKNFFIEEALLLLEYQYKFAEHERQFETAYRTYKQLITLRDSVQNAKSYKITLQRDYEHNLQLQEQQRKIERESEAMTRIYLYVGLASLLGLVFFAFRAFYIKSKTLSIISTQKAQIDNQKKALESTYQQLKITTDELEKSLNYASRIQNLILPASHELESFFLDYFVIFKPKDVVSGDFYWFKQIDKYTGIFALGDCTGHGVPGAFMTMLANALLYEIVTPTNYSPANILLNLHQSIFNILRQQEGRNTDGMDISICLFEKNTNLQSVKATFAGSKSIFYFVESKKLHRINGDKKRIGGKTYPNEVFTNISFETGLRTTYFYFLSDGFADQNDHQRRKFGIIQLQEFFTNHHELPADEQKQKLLEALQAHQQDESQRDDISLVGLRLS